MGNAPFQSWTRLSGPLLQQGQTLSAGSQRFSWSLELTSSISNGFYVSLGRKGPTVTLNVFSQFRLPAPKSQNPTWDKTP